MTEDYDKPLLLRPREVARMLGICLNQIYKLAERGELPSVRIGRSVRIPSGALHVWLEEKIGNGKRV
ncbi:MAG: helix-turn-helix domain-containing protein [bacterium]|nr:helix-turn-helix domain-containing protein [bacterium]